VTAFIDTYRGRFGVELICRILEVSARAYYRRKTGARSARAVEDGRLTSRIRDLHRENYECYGYRRIHVCLRRAGEHDVGRDQVARLMRQAGLQGARRGGKLGGRRSPILRLRSGQSSSNATRKRRPARLP
jgi:putative transposase